jgi:hypothetical protein
MPFLVFGALGFLLWLSRRAPQSVVTLLPPAPSGGLPAQSTGLAAFAPRPAAFTGDLAVQAVQVAQLALLGQHTGHGGGGGGGYGGSGGGHGGGWGNPARWGWGGGFVDPDIVVEDGAQTPFALPGFGPFGTGTPGPYGFGTTATDARPVTMAGHGGGGGGGGGGGHGGGRGGGGGGGGWGPWYSPLEIVDNPLIVPVAVPVSPTPDIVAVCAWAVQSADSRTLRGLISQYASVPAAVQCLSQRLAQIEPYGL